MTPTQRANQATLREAVEITGVKLTSIQWAMKRGVIRAGRQVKRCAPGFRYVVDLEDVEAWKATRYLAPLESNDPQELARIRGIKVRSAQRLIRRRAKHGGEGK